MNKKLILPVGAILAISFVLASVAYFHQTQVSLNVDEARSSADIPFSLSGYSGETQTQTLTIHNSANVPLKAILTWQEEANPNSVTYIDNLPATIDLAPNTDTTFIVSFTFDEVTESGQVNGTINYEKTA